jgi:hypothetical protein
MPGLIESNLDGTALVQDLSNFFTFLQAAETLELSMLPTTKINKRDFQDQVDDYGSTDDIEGVLSNAPVTSTTDQLANMGYTQNFAMKMRETWAVDDMADTVDENPAFGAGGFRPAQIKKALIRLKMRMAKQVFSLIEGRRQTGALPYRSCSIGGFIKSGAPSGDQLVPAIARPSASMIYTGTWADLAPGGATPLEDTLRGIMRVRYDAAFGMSNLVLVAGSQLKQRVSDCSIFRANVTGATVVRRVNDDEDSTLSAVVDHLQTDFGKLDIVPSTRVRRVDATNTAVSSTLAQQSGYILDKSKWGIGYRRNPINKDLPDNGGGTSGEVSAIYGLRAYFPGANGAILPAS